MFHENNGCFFRFGDFEVDASKRSLKSADRFLSLKPKAFDVLVALLEKNGEVVTKTELLERVWPDQFVEEGNLTVHIAAIRKALGQKKNSQQFIATIPGQGYQFVGDLHIESDELLIEEHSVSRITIEDQCLDHLPRTAPEIVEGKRSKFSGLALSDGRRWWAIGGTTIVLLAFAAYLTSPRIFGGRGLFAKSVPDKSSKQLTAVGTVSNAHLSPDGRNFVYQTFENGEYTLWFESTTGGYPVQIVPPGPGRRDGFSFSPDGNFIFYVSGGDLYKMPTMGGPADKLFSGVPPTYALSRDGETISFVLHDNDNGNDTLVVQGLHTGERRDVLTLDDGRKFSSYPSFSPDGSEITIGLASKQTAALYQLSSVNIHDGSLRVLNDQKWDQISKTVWLDDDSGILFNAIGPNSDFHIWLLELASGTMRCITDDLSRYGRASLSASGNSTEFLAVRDEVNSSIWISQASTTAQQRRITSGTFGKLDGSAGLAWTAGGRLVYSSFFDNSFSIWTVDPEKGEPRQLTTSGFGDRFPTASRDGKYIFFESNRGGGEDIWRIDSDGRHLVQLTNGGNDSHPSITPAGNWFVYSSGDRGSRSIWKVSVEGGQAVKLTSEGYDLPKVSPDGRNFACTHVSSTPGSHEMIALVPIDGGEPIREFESPATSTLNNGFFWTPDGSAIVYRDFTLGLWKQNIAGGPPEKMQDVPNEHIYYLDWSGDGRLALSYGNELRDVVLVKNFH